MAAFVTSQPGHVSAPPSSLARHARELCGVVGPLAVAQLCQMGMGVTDSLLLGSLGAHALAAGGLAAGAFFTISIVLQSVLASVSVLIAHARGGGHTARIPAIYASGMLLALLLMLPNFALISAAGPILRAIGEPPEIAQDVAAYLDVLRWGIPGGMLGLGLMRAVLTATGDVGVLLVMAPVLLVMNGLLNYGLIHGVGPLPRLGYLGSAAASAISLWTGAIVLLAYVHRRPRLRDLVRLTAPRLAYLRELAAIGLPIGATVAVETFLFLVTGLLMGMLGPAALAAHQIAMNVTSFVFMVPLAIGQAANARVGFWSGAGARHEARRAGFVALGMSIGFMLAVALVLLLVPRLIARLYLGGSVGTPAETIGIAASLLGVAALFQVADGVQVVAAGGLRGLKDTRVPLLLAAAGYWGIGFPIGYLLGFPLGLGPVGLWIGLAAGLGVVATLLTARFHQRTRAALPAGGG